MAERADGRIDDQLLLLEHPAVLTLGRGSDPAHIRADAATLAARGIEVVRVERGGEVTYHGPGQLVAYPIVALARRGLLVRPVRPRPRGRAVRDLRRARRRAPAGATAIPAAGAIRTARTPRKIGALGLRVERGVSYHGDRAQRDHRPGRLRADRRVRHARRRSRRRSPPSSGDADAQPDDRRRWRPPAWVFARALAPRDSAPPLARP